MGCMEIAPGKACAKVSTHTQRSQVATTYAVFSSSTPYRNLDWLATSSCFFLSSASSIRKAPERGATALGDGITLRFLSRRYTSGTPVGISSFVISSSEMLSRYLSIPRIELPWAATRTVLPRPRAGTMEPSQYGRQRSTVSLRHSESGMSASGMCAYLLSLPGQYLELLSIGGGGSE